MFFSTKHKEKPRIITSELEIEYDVSSKFWETEFKGTTFYFEGSSLVLPTSSSLLELLAVLNLHKTHIDNKLDEMVNGWKEEGVEMNRKSAHLSSVTVENEGELSASFMGDESWGDLGYDIWLSNGKIVNEGVAD